MKSTCSGSDRFMFSVLVLFVISYATLGIYLKTLNLSFLICKIRVILTLTSEGYLEH